MVKKLWFMALALTLAVPMTVFGQGEVFELDLGTDTLFKHTADDISDYTEIGIASPAGVVPYNVIAMDADSAGTLYAVDLGPSPFAGPYLLGTIDPADATFTVVAELNGDATRRWCVGNDDRHYNRYLLYH